MDIIEQILESAPGLEGYVRRDLELLAYNPTIASLIRTWLSITSLLFPPPLESDENPS